MKIKKIEFIYYIINQSNNYFQIKRIYIFSQKYNKLNLNNIKEMKK